MTGAPLDPGRRADEFQFERDTLARAVTRTAVTFAKTPTFENYETFIEATDRLIAFDCPLSDRGGSLPPAVPLATGPSPDVSCLSTSDGPAVSLEDDPKGD